VPSFGQAWSNPKSITNILSMLVDSQNEN